MLCDHCEHTCVCQNSEVYAKIFKLLLKQFRDLNDNFGTNHIFEFCDPVCYYYAGFKLPIRDEPGERGLNAEATPPPFTYTAYTSINEPDKQLHDRTKT